MRMQTFWQMGGKPRVLSSGTPKNRADIGSCPGTYLYNASLGDAGGGGGADVGGVGGGGGSSDNNVSHRLRDFNASGGSQQS